MKHFIIFFTGFLFSSCLCSVLRNNVDNVSPELCESLSCIQSAITILNNMDTSVEPCDNFYNFVCGKFVKNTIIPDDKSSVSTYALTRKLVLNQLYALFQVDRAENDLNIFKNVKGFYDLCMDLEDIEKKEEYPGWAIFKLVGKWPVLEEHWDDSSYSWQEQVFTMKKNGLSSNFIVDVSISRDQKNDTRYVLSMDQPSLGINKEYWLKGKDHPVVKGYLEYMFDIVQLFLRGKTSEQVKHDMINVYNFEKKLSEISLRRVDRRNQTKIYNPMTIKEIQEKYSYVNWLNYINSLYNGHLTVDENEIVIVAVPSYLEKLGEILDSTPKRTISNYLLWRVAKGIVGYMPKQFRERALQYGALFTGKTIKSPRWEDCLDSTANAFNLAVGSMYVRKYFDPDGKNGMMDIINNVRSIFTNTLENLDWMTEEVKKSALKKMAAMTNHIAYPEELMDDSKIEEYYKDFQPKPNIGYLEYNLELNKFFFKLKSEKFRKPINKTDWVAHGAASVVNAFYSTIDNSIQFPAGVLQGMFFGRDRPNYLNYGSIGFTVGHEITHGFDDRGRQFDKDGLLINWWDESTGKKFLDKAKCIIDQYTAVEVSLSNKYNPDDARKNLTLHLNGVNTQGENIADNGGLKHAYMAYRKWSDGKVEARLPGLGNYTQNQLFWVSAATKWCSVYKPQILENMILNDVHSPGEFRINIPMGNIPEFSNDWNCPKGSPMNPEHKCVVW